MASQNLISTIEMIIRSNTGQRFEYVSGCVLYGDYLQCTAVSHFTIVRYELSFHSGGFLRVTIHPNLGNDCIKCWQPTPCCLFFEIISRRLLVKWNLSKKGTFLFLVCEKSSFLLICTIFVNLYFLCGVFSVL